MKKLRLSSGSIGYEVNGKYYDSEGGLIEKPMIRSSQPCDSVPFDQDEPEPDLFGQDEPVPEPVQEKRDIFGNPNVDGRAVYDS